MLFEQQDIKKTNWSNEQIQYQTTVDRENGNIKVNLVNEGISFHFDKEENFIGICNYKE
jgi:hypothetical protein